MLCEEKKVEPQEEKEILVAELQIFEVSQIAHQSPGLPWGYYLATSTAGAAVRMPTALLPSRSSGLIPRPSAETCAWISPAIPKTC